MEDPEQGGVGSFKETLIVLSILPDVWRVVNERHPGLLNGKPPQGVEHKKNVYDNLGGSCPWCDNALEEVCTTPHPVPHTVFICRKCKINVSDAITGGHIGLSELRILQNLAVRAKLVGPIRAEVDGWLFIDDYVICPMCGDARSPDDYECTCGELIPELI